MININCLNPIASVGMNLFSSDYAVSDDMSKADAVLVRSASMHELELSDNLKAISRAGAGVNNIPIEECAKAGVVVFNTPGANANGVKELVIAGLLLASRDIVGGINWVRDNKEDPDISKSVEKIKAKFAGGEIEGKKLGVIGLGAIGVLVANAANRLGMTVYGCDPFISVNHAWNLSRDIIRVKTKEEIYKECDFITIHVPLLDDTKHMICSDTIQLMKDGVILLNFSRDSLVDDKDMADALKSGKIAKYVTDFPNQATAGMDGIIAIPHLGASTEESEDNCAVMAVRQVIDYIENGNISNSVNYPSCHVGVCETAGRIAINHRNIPKMLNQFTTIFSTENINISHMINKSKKDFAYSVFDIESPTTQELADKIMEIDGVLKVRIIK